MRKIFRYLHAKAPQRTHSNPMKIRSKGFALCHNNNNKKRAFYAQGSDMVVPSKVQLQKCRNGGKQGDVGRPRSPAAKGRLGVGRTEDSDDGILTTHSRGVGFERIIGPLGRQKPNSKRDASYNLLGYRKNFDALLLFLC